MNPIDWLPERFKSSATSAKGWIVSASSFALALVIVGFEIYKGVDLKSTNGLIALVLVVIGLIAQREKSSLEELKADVAAIQAQNRAADVRAGDHARELGELRQALAHDHRVMTFESAINRLIATVHQAGPIERLEIEHLGLDMTHAPEQIRRLFRALPRVRSVSYRVLMIARAADSPNVFEEDVDALLESGARRRKEFARDLMRISRELEREGRTLESELRFYETIPVLHGFRIVTPLAVASLSLCRWHEGEYHWGADQYRFLNETGISGSDRDLLAVLKNTFCHYWEKNRVE